MKNNSTRTLFTFILWLLLLPCLANAVEPQVKQLCKGESANIDCAIKHFDRLYSEDYDRFWHIFSLAEKQAITCKSVNATAKFLAAARVKKGNAEFNEYYAQVVEKELLDKKPKCFLDASLKVNNKTRKVIFTDLQTPLYLENSKVDGILEGFKGNQKYKSLLDIYYGK